jgi:hypothetical protein
VRENKIYKWKKNLNIVAPSGKDTCYDIENSREIIHKD